MLLKSPVDYFLDANCYFGEDGKIPYYLASKIQDLAYILSEEQKGLIITDILAYDKANIILRNYQNYKILPIILPELSNLVSVPQSKGKTKNAFEHTLNVIKTVPSNQHDIRWCALLHDLGKYESYLKTKDFRRHEQYSYEISRLILERHNLLSQLVIDRILTIVLNHMTPLHYQRVPNWNKSTVRSFMERCRGNVEGVIKFAYYDKKAENNIPEYLAIIEQLLDIVNKIKEEDNAYNRTEIPKTDDRI